MAVWNSGFLQSDDLIEAFSAFMEKRAPKFTGTGPVRLQVRLIRVRSSDGRSTAPSTPPPTRTAALLQGGDVRLLPSFGSDGVHDVLGLSRISAICSGSPGRARLR